jgi:rabenosyn-5
MDDASSINSSVDRGSINPNTGLPVGMRRDKCSLLLVADWKTGRGQEVEEGFVGWLKVDPESATTGGAVKGHSGKTSSGGAGKEEVQEVMIKGVRVCRECWQTVSWVFLPARAKGEAEPLTSLRFRRKQQMQERHRITGFTKLYEVCMQPSPRTSALPLRPY